LFPHWEHGTWCNARHRSQCSCRVLAQAPGNESFAGTLAQTDKRSAWTSTDDVRTAVPTAKVLNGERVRFEVAGGNYRLVVAFDFRRQIAFVKFIGTHAQYDGIDALTVSQF
jgi:mRNA interferase HigB